MAQNVAWEPINDKCRSLKEPAFVRISADAALGSVGRHVATVAAALEVPLGTTAAIWSAAAIDTDVVGAALAAGNAHGLPDDFIAAHLRAGGKVNTYAGPATVGDARSRARFAHRWQGIAEDIAVTLAWIGVGNAVAITDSRQVAGSATIGRAGTAVAWRWQTNIGCVARRSLVAILIAVATVGLVFVVASEEVARHTGRRYETGLFIAWRTREFVDRDTTV